MLLDETTTQPDDGTQGTGNSDAQPEGVSEDQGADGASSENAQPEAGASASQPFHKEGDREFATKEEYISWVNKQRGAATKLASKYKAVEKQALEFQQAFNNAQATINKLSSGAPVSEAKREEAAATLTDEQRTVQAQLRALLKDDLAPVAEVRKLQERSAFLESEYQRMKQAESLNLVQSFSEANPDMEGHEEDLAEIIQAGRAKSLEDAYTIFFGKKPNQSRVAASRDAYRKGQETVIRRSQAGARPNGKAAPGAEKGKSFWAWDKLGTG